MPNRNLGKNVNRGIAMSIFCVLTTACEVKDIQEPEVSLLTRSYSNARTGINPREQILNTSNVNADSFGKLFERGVDGDIYAQPLYVPDLEIPGKGRHNVVFVATMHNSIYAFDGDDPLLDEPLWHSSFIDPGAGITPVPTSSVGGECGIYRDIQNEIGILSTPVIDRESNTIYVVTRTKRLSPDPHYAQHLHALDITTGAEKPGSPVSINASVAGRGAGSVNGVINFDPLIQNQRAALLLHDGIVYIAWASHCDTGPYHGLLLGYDAINLEQKIVFNTTPDGVDGGIWQSGEGLSVDEEGYIYVVVGNGDDSVRSGGRGYGNSVLKLEQKGEQLIVVDWFIPFKSDDMNSYDFDLSTPAMLLPGMEQVIVAGKVGTAFLIDTSDMGRFTPDGPDRIPQSWRTAFNPHYTPQIPFFRNGKLWLYSWDSNINLMAFEYGISTGRFNETPVTEGRKDRIALTPGGVMTITHSKDETEDAIVWANFPEKQNANQETAEGTLVAYDASDLSVELWSSRDNMGRDNYGNLAKFCPPAVINGKVYMATFSKKLVVYGLLNTVNH
jgi:hypothetical protein